MKGNVSPFFFFISTLIIFWPFPPFQAGRAEKHPPKLRVASEDTVVGVMLDLQS